MNLIGLVNKTDLSEPCDKPNISLVIENSVLNKRAFGKMRSNVPLLFDLPLWLSSAFIKAINLNYIV